MSRSQEYRRADRVGELIRQELAEILLKEVKDPRVGTVTITRVKVTDDLRQAKVYFGVLDRTTQVEEVAQGLEKATGHIHRLLGKRLRMRIIPRLSFSFDRNLDYSFHISRILRDIEADEG
ncbi:MAG: 30S ribosome-binding factor RbfA [bacterium]|nr:MAG: 30S ribosome-binding factor RbfA [bacterium]